MLAEVLSLADLGGIRSYVEAAHPRLAVMLAQGGDPDRSKDGPTADAAERGRGPFQQGGAPPVSGGLLTPKEARILSLLATGKANKEIARVMDIGEQTVKWHLKNVFFKLNAASRKHAVDRARLLGLLEIRGPHAIPPDARGRIAADPVQESRPIVRGLTSTRTFDPFTRGLPNEH
jgi:LuxR family maltose regulon positive regulatory protein